METREILALFDRQVRRDAVGEHVERTERSTLFVGDGWSAVLWSDLDEETADAEIARLVPRLRALPGYAEWKLYGHDRPADLPQRLVAAGLRPEDEEVVLVAPLAELTAEAPEGVDVRVASDAETIATFIDLNERVFGERYDEIGRELERALAEDPPSTLAVVCLADGEPVSGARIDFNAQSDFAGLYGGATVPEWRGRGLYRATVAKRAELARERGYRYLFVDALPTSRPILERLGFVQITTTTPFV